MKYFKLFVFGSIFKREGREGSKISHKLIYRYGKKKWSLAKEGKKSMWLGLGKSLTFFWERQKLNLISFYDKKILYDPFIFIK